MNWEQSVIGGIGTGLLMILYLGVLVLACVRRVNPKMTFWQVTFIVFLTLGTLLRTCNWCIKLLQSQDVDIGDILTQRTIFYLFEVPNPFLLGAYLDLLCLWSYVYDTIQYEFRGDSEIKFRVILMLLVGVIFGVFISLFLVDLILFPTDNNQNLIVFANVCQQAVTMFSACCYILLGFGFAYKGLRFYWFFKTSDTTMPLYYEYAKKQQEDNILPRIKHITILCALCFSLRGVLTLLRAVINIPTQVYWFIFLPYWGILEVLPLTLMLFILKKPKQNDAQPLMMSA